jgi:hypothetical protein
MEALRFKVEVNFEEGKTYSVCLRGARRYPKDEFDLSLYTPEFWEKPKAIANIVSQKQYRFRDVDAKYCIDNYDETARHYYGLLTAMNNVYKDFDDREIITILQFVIV